MLISVVFIIGTLIVYGCIPKLRNLNGKCLMNYLTVLAIGYTLMAWNQTNPMYRDQMLLCFSIGYILYFTFCSAFSWLTGNKFLTYFYRKFLLIKKNISLFKTFILLILNYHNLMKLSSK